jgi:hypothetical protein
MIDSDFYVQCKQWQKQVTSGLDAIIDRACRITNDEPLHTMSNALALLAKEFGDVIPITPETMQDYKSKVEAFNLRVDLDFEKCEIRIIKKEVNTVDEDSSNWK